MGGQVISSAESRSITEEHTSFKSLFERPTFCLRWSAWPSPAWSFLSFCMLYRGGHEHHSSPQSQKNRLGYKWPALSIAAVTSWICYILGASTRDSWLSQVVVKTRLNRSWRFTTWKPLKIVNRKMARWSELCIWIIPFIRWQLMISKSCALPWIFEFDF